MAIEDKEKLLLSLDSGFPDRVLKTSFFLSLLMIICSLSSVSLISTLSLAIGCFISLGFYKTLWWTIQRAISYRGENQKPKIQRFFLKIGLLKYFTMGAILLSSCLFLDINIIATALGLGIVIIVMMMKIGSKLIVGYVNRAVKVPFKDSNV
ncbi:MAG: hypothetical protein E3K32_02520 [wastewater metagenome]|nr:hypothetical protein [Candidatus Loosdrechtia aerotolerans]